MIMHGLKWFMHDHALATRDHSINALSRIIMHDHDILSILAEQTPTAFSLLATLRVLLSIPFKKHTPKHSVSL